MATPWLNVPHQTQPKPSWCLPACVAMVSAYWGEPLLQADIARWLGTSSIGTPANRVQRLSQRGFDVLFRTGSLADLKNWLTQDIPCILFVRTGDLPYWTVDTPHAVVLAGLLDDEEAYLFDPGVDDAPQKVTAGDLMLAWSPFDYAYAVITPTA